MHNIAAEGEADPAPPERPLTHHLLAQSWDLLVQDLEALVHLPVTADGHSEQSAAALHRLDALLATTLGAERSAWPAQFQGLAVDLQVLVLSALVSAGVTDGRRSEPSGALLRALRCYQMAIALGTGSEPGAATPADLGPWRAVFMAQSADAQAHVLKALSDFASTTASQGWRQPCHLALALPMMERQDADLNIVALLRQQPLQDEALSPAADFWLTYLGAGLAHHPSGRARSVGGRREDPDIVSLGRSVELTWPSATAPTNPSR